MTVILASASASRRAMLQAAGVDFAVQPARIDEQSAKRDHLGSPEALAAALAEAKAASVSGLVADAWVVGSDSVVALDGRLYSKPASRDEAGDHLRAFSGRELRLASAAALATNGEIGWSHVGEARLKVRALTESFIDSYLGQEWPAVAACVGVFRIEGRGVQLFEAIDGDYFTILGMPLLPLLGALRARGMLAS